MNSCLQNPHCTELHLVAHISMRINAVPVADPLLAS